MSNVRHRIFVGHPVTTVETPTTETFYILAENGDRILSEDGNDLIIAENG